ncbi:cytochrome ubiquinol oxidase subunit I, partial [Streptomyces sp. NPDC058661]
ATSCPPPRHNFLTLPKIRSESPAFDLNYPALAALDPGKSARRDVIDEPGGATHDGPDAGREA